MKRLIIFLFAAAILHSACDILNNQEPQQSTPLDDLYSSTEELENALIGAYSDAQNGDAMGSSYPLFGELMGENTSWSGSFEEWAQISSHDMTVGNLQIEDVWNVTYQVINDANLIIAATESGTIDDPDFAANRDRIQGEALFLRALLHFEAVRMWAKPWGTTADNSHAGIPVVISATDEEADFEDRSRNTVQEVYDQVISDLQSAITLLEGAPVTASRANEWSARGLLARVYLQQGNYEEVAALTGEIIGSNEYSLEGNPQDYFFTPEEEGSPEAVFDIVHTTQDNPGVNNSLSTFYASEDFGGRGDVQISESFLAALDAATPASQEGSLPAGYTFEDLRFTELVYNSGTPTDSTDDATLKYEDGTNTDDNAPIIRYPDILLMRAEALVETGAFPSPEAQEAIDLLNEVHLRAIRVFNEEGGSADASQYFGYEAADFASAQELIDAILLERRVELAFEGQRKHDLVRRDMTVKGDAPDADNMAWPIPQSELDANTEIEQNPGY